MKEVLIERDGHIGLATLNRPDRLNAISGPMLDQLTQALLELDADRQVRVIVLTGTDPGFCAGLDLKDVAAGNGIHTPPLVWSSPTRRPPSVATRARAPA